jgi:pSer/pThr/pTyr-binding forkhead associated (FHA) protein
MNGDRITTIEPNGVKRTRPITARGLVIGRGSDCELAIAYAAVSRYHAQITFDRGRYYVTDLNSANGTYLGNNRLEPNMPTVWMPGQALRIGDVFIHLEQLTSTTSKAEARAEPEAELVLRTETDTLVGVFPEADRERNGKGKSRSLVWVLIALVVSLCLVALCAAAAAYYFLL